MPQPHASNRTLALEFQRIKCRVGQSVILDDVMGVLTPGCITALLGPTGSGKTTLLDILAFRKNSGKVFADIRLGNKPCTRSLVQGHSSYVEQHETLIAFLTVEEMLYYNAQLKLPSRMTQALKRERVEGVIGQLSLQQCRHVRIGDALQKGISGGEAKRTSLALALVNRPALLFLDEPTTGLDAVTAHEVVSVLADLAASGMTVCTTVHQPPQSVFRCFQQLLCLLDGRLVYFGPNGKPALEFLQGALPATVVPSIEVAATDAEWIMHVMCNAKKSGQSGALAQTFKASALGGLLRARLGMAPPAEEFIPPQGGLEARRVETYDSAIDISVLEKHEAELERDLGPSTIVLGPSPSNSFLPTSHRFLPAAIMPSSASKPPLPPPAPSSAHKAEEEAAVPLPTRTLPSPSGDSPLMPAGMVGLPQSTQVLLSPCQSDSSDAVLGEARQVHSYALNVHDECEDALGVPWEQDRVPSFHNDKINGKGLGAVKLRVTDDAEGTESVAALAAAGNSFWWQLQVLVLHRALRQYRDWRFTAARLMDKVVFVFLMGSVFWNINERRAEINSVKNVAGALFIWAVLPPFACFMHVPSIALERALFIRERHDRLYGAAAYLAAKLVQELVLLLPVGIGAAVTIWYCLGPLNGSLAVFWAMASASSIMGAMLAYFFAAASPTMDLANAAIPCYLSWCALYVGFVLPWRAIPVWWRWFTYVDPLRYLFAGYMVNQFRGSQWEEDVLKELGVSSRQPWYYFGVVCGFVVAYGFLAWLALVLLRHHRR